VYLGQEFYPIGEFCLQQDVQKKHSMDGDYLERDDA